MSEVITTINNDQAFANDKASSASVNNLEQDKPVQDPNQVAEHTASEEITEAAKQELHNDEQQNDLQHLESITEVPSAKEKEEKSEEKLDFWDQIGEKYPWTKKFMKKFPLYSNMVAAGFHTIASIAPFVKFVSKPLAAGLDKFAVNFARYVVPLNFIKNGLHAFRAKKKSLVEGLIRLSLPAMLMTNFLPFVNFMVAYGLHSGLSLIYQGATNKLKEKGIESFSSFADNTKHVWRETKGLFTNFTKSTLTDQSYVISGLLMLFGSVGGLAFAKNDRDTFAAKLFGIAMRNLGGVIGDGVLILEHAKGIGKNMTLGEIVKTFKKEGMKMFSGFWKNHLKSWKADKDTKLIGVFCGLASLLGPAMRLVKDDNIGNILSHAIEALNNYGYTIWGNLGNKEDDKDKDNIDDPPHPIIAEAPDAQEPREGNLVSFDQLQQARAEAEAQRAQQQMTQQQLLAQAETNSKAA